MTDRETDLSPARPRILLVDDVEINRDVIGRLLERAGYDVDVACDGETACAETWSTPYDLVLMDIEMPGMNGFEAAARIRAREGVMSGVKIVALTATIHPQAKQYAFWSGIDAFISKPIEPKDFLRKVAGVVAQGAPTGNDWEPVWRLAVFAEFAERVGDVTAEDFLDEYLTRLKAIASAIDRKQSASDAFFWALHDLHSQASLLGFEEIAGLCARYADLRGQKDARCRDPNMLGAIDRARYAAEVYRRDQSLAPEIMDWWSRMRVNVQTLFRGKLARAPRAAPAF